MRRARATAERLGIDPRAVTGLAVLVVGTVLWLLAFVGGGFRNPFAGAGDKVRADFANIGAIVERDPVRVGGVQVGRVSKIEELPGGGGRLTLELEGDAPKIYNDATASILWRTALGANEAIKLVPGTAAKGELKGDLIPRSRTTSQVELDEITRSLSGRAQPGLRTMLRELGPALSDRESLGRALETLTDVAPSARVGIEAIRGQVKDADLRNLVRDAGRTARALDVGTDAATTRRFVEAAATTLDAIPQDKLRYVVRNLGQTLEIAEQGHGNMHRMLTAVDSVLPKLHAEVPAVAPTLRRLRPTVVNARELLDAADPLLRELRPTTRSLARSARTGTPVINELSPSLERARDKILPGLEEVTPEENLPVYKLIGPTFVGLGTLSGFRDGDGQMANLTAGLGQSQAQQFFPCTFDFSGMNFLVCGALNDAMNIFFSGGSKMLSRLAKKPGLEAVYAPLLKNALKLESRLARTQQKIAEARPRLAELLFEPRKRSGR